ncbi:hypothetical protein CR513_62642, partial [Mucuna pruriens]
MGVRGLGTSWEKLVCPILGKPPTLGGLSPPLTVIRGGYKDWRRGRNRGGEREERSLARTLAPTVGLQENFRHPDFLKSKDKGNHAHHQEPIRCQEEAEERHAEVLKVAEQRENELCQQLATIKAQVYINGGSDTLNCKLFLGTLKGVAMQWLVARRTVQCLLGIRRPSSMEELRARVEKHIDPEEDLADRLKADINPQHSKQKPATGSRRGLTYVKGDPSGLDREVDPARPPRPLCPGKEGGAIDKGKKPTTSQLGKGAKCGKARERSWLRTCPSTSYYGTITTIVGGDTFQGAIVLARKRHVKAIMVVQDDVSRPRDPIICFSNENYEGIPPHQDDLMDRVKHTNNPCLLHSCQHLGLLQHDHWANDSEQTESSGVDPAPLHEIPHGKEVGVIKVDQGVARCWCYEESLKIGRRASNHDRVSGSRASINFLDLDPRQQLEETMTGRGFEGNPYWPL